MITSVKISGFKAIEKIDIKLDKINVLVGPNNAGKSSILQAVQFFVSTAQTAKIFSDYTYNRYLSGKKKGNKTWSTSISPDQLFYSPLKNPYALGHNAPLSQGRTIEMIIYDDSVQDSAKFVVSKGRNRNLTIAITGDRLVEDIASLETLYSMYVPGIAGISSEEEVKPIGSVRKTAAKGDSNIVFRNVLLLLYNNAEKWDDFITQIRSIFPLIEFEVISRADIDGSIEVNFRMHRESDFIPIDLAGTGILQAIQIIAYVNYFKPRMILLDEPDSHLHPNNQRMLAELLSLLVENDDLTILVSTHSRHLMSALRNQAKFFLVKDGGVSSDKFDYYQGLIELGALYDYDSIKAGDVKYIVLTEDSKEGSIKELETIMLASGYEKDDFRVYSYNGVDKIESAKMFARFLLELCPELHIIVYRDADGLKLEEKEKIIRNLEFNNHVHCVISEGNDIEYYFCNPKHIDFICKKMGKPLTLERIIEICTAAEEIIKEESLRKFAAHRVDIVNDKVRAAQIAVEATIEFQKNPHDYIYGKAYNAQIRSLLQRELGRNVDLCAMSEFITDEKLVAIKNA